MRTTYSIDIRAAYNDHDTSTWIYSGCTAVSINDGVLSFVTKSGLKCLVPWVNVIRVYEEKPDTKDA